MNTPSERTAIIGHLDAIVDSYIAGTHDLESLVVMRRELVGYAYRLSSHFKQVWGEAELSDTMRRYAAAREIVRARNDDAKASQVKLETETEALDATLQNRKDAIWKDAEREAVKAKLSLCKEVSSAMAQEISNLAWEKRNANRQTQEA